MQGTAACERRWCGSALGRGLRCAQPAERACDAGRASSAVAAEQHLTAGPGATPCWRRLLTESSTRAQPARAILQSVSADRVASGTAVMGAGVRGEVRC